MAIIEANMVIFKAAGVVVKFGESLKLHKPPLENLTKLKM